MVFADVCDGTGYDPEDPDINTTPYLLTKIYEYLMGDINIPPAIDKAEASLYFAEVAQDIVFAGEAHDPDPVEDGGPYLSVGLR
ncbi:MAG: hypothetical protein ACOX4C_02315 [Bacillota bacterium]